MDSIILILTYVVGLLFYIVGILFFSYFWKGFIDKYVKFKYKVKCKKFIREIINLIISIVVIYISLQLAKNNIFIAAIIASSINSIVMIILKE